MLKKNLWVQAIAVAVIGAVFSLAANALSPRGLDLRRDYFPRSEAPAVVPQPGTEFDREDPAVQRLLQRGLQPISGEELLRLVNEPAYEHGLVVVVDARRDPHYQSGHIPGAWQFDHYRMENYLPDVLPACLNAQKVVVYCTGGDCEDSEFAAIILRDAGVPQENLFVYIGGIAEWRKNNWPIETGLRSSGQQTR